MRTSFNSMRHGIIAAIPPKFSEPEDVVRKSPKSIDEESLRRDALYLLLVI